MIKSLATVPGRMVCPPWVEGHVLGPGVWPIFSLLSCNQLFVGANKALREILESASQPTWLSFHLIFTPFSATNVIINHFSGNIMQKHPFNPLKQAKPKFWNPNIPHPLSRTHTSRYWVAESYTLQEYEWRNSGYLGQPARRGVRYQQINRCD